MRPAPAACKHGFPGSRSWVAALSVAVAVGSSSTAQAGPIAVVSAVLFMAQVYIVLVIALSALAFFLLGRMADPRRRAFARTTLLVAVYAPVPLWSGSASTISSAFLVWLSQSFGAGMGQSSRGLLAHPMLLAYAIVLAGSLSIVAAWMAVGDRYRR